MTSTDDQVYFARRAVEERRRADIAADSAIATAHLRMAAEYERRLQAQAEEAMPVQSGPVATRH